MENYNMTCSECGKEFHVKVTSENVPGGKFEEDITCPYCQAENGHRLTSGSVFTYKIDDNSENRTK